MPSADEWEDGQVGFKELINDYEAQLIIQAMKITKGNKKRSSKTASPKKNYITEKIKKKNLQNMLE